ncbi:AbgT family transporter [Marinisporobacter balticus]|uniref:Aminobenzoyl-glutamate transport protein n=1 Tax=Marinisporobacter balticus TaxID=2018667 RepID=A0A4R2KFE4_9FIRM|nr:AbgT family transporter [Marinisporobacter balticus]TCO69069.1 aminobenzoyl-glutamate transport protein [Marinisporobacter balticus]
MKAITKEKKKSHLDKMLAFIEKSGNRLPDPITLFVIFCGLVLVVSYLAAKAGVSAVHPSTKETITVVNLLTKEGLRDIVGKAVNNFQSFPPLGLVLVVMIGAGVAEKSGFMKAVLKHSITKVPANLVTAMIILVGILANAAGDAGFIVLPPLAAIIFLGIGRHPLIGLFAAYAGVSGGFAANLMINMSDVLAASFTIPAAQMIDPSYQGTPAMNLYFIIISTLFLVVAGVWVTEKIVAPRFPKYEGIHTKKKHSTALRSIEKKGLIYASLSIFVMVLIVIGLCIGKDSFMQDVETGSVLAYHSTLMQGIIPIVTCMFLIPGLIYGKITGTIKTDKDATAMMGSAMSDMGPYIVLAFVASQFLAYFKWSNLGVVISIKGADFLQNAGMTGYGLIIGFILISCFINIFVGSASAKWAIMAPVFVPMFLLVGYDPALTQMAYRIGDSITNTISPLFPYFPILLAFVNKYDKKAGMGTIIANMLPYSIVFGLLWTVLLIVFMVFNLPLGPNAGIHYLLH